MHVIVRVMLSFFVFSMFISIKITDIHHINDEEKNKSAI